MRRLGLPQVGMGNYLMSPMIIKFVLMVVDVQVNLKQLREWQRDD